MILTRRKQTAPKQLTNGIWRVTITSISEHHNSVIFTFKCPDGTASLTLPINKRLIQILSELMHYTLIQKFTSVSQFIGKKIHIEIINNKVKHLFR